MGDSKIFKCGFDITDYKDILPDWQEYAKNDVILNLDEQQKGNIENCYWQKHTPTFAETTSHEFREREATRILKTGVWIAVKEEILWISPNYYFALQYGKGGASDLQFRLKRLKNVYHKIRARKNAGCIGTLTLKSRGDGETTMSITDAFWECLDGNMETGQIGIQSKTRDDSINPCWNYVQTLWQSLPLWLKTDLCSDFASGNNIAEKMQWQRSGDESRGLKPRNVLMKYYPSGTPMDGKHDMKLCLLDEVCKYEEGATFYQVFTNYKKFIMPGFERRGMFNMFSSPADKPCVSNEEVYSLWKDSNPDDIIPAGELHEDGTVSTGTTKSRIHRYYSNPLEGIAGAYDKYGDADPEKIYDHIMSERKNVDKDKKFAEIRGFPLNEKEMFETSDAAGLWKNTDGIKARKIYLLKTRFKDPIKKEPTVVYGNLEWKGGVIDSDVFFRMADKAEFDLRDARFAFSYLPKNREELEQVWVEKVQGHRPAPPKLVANIIGIDPIDKRHSTRTKGKKKRRLSNMGMVNTKFLDFYQTGIVDCPTGIYSCRPQHNTTAFEDAIKFAVFTQAMVQTESVTSKIIDYFEDRGYFDWLLPKRGENEKSTNKGDAPSGSDKGAFLNEIIGLIDAATNIPINPADPYLLELNWFHELLQDVEEFDDLDTQKSDLTMAWGQSLLGKLKLLQKKRRRPSKLNSSVMSYMLD